MTHSSVHSKTIFALIFHPLRQTVQGKNSRRPNDEGRIQHCHRSADFQVCCVAGFQTRKLPDCERPADLEVGDTAGLETCATEAGRAAAGASNIKYRRVRIPNIGCSMFNVGCSMFITFNAKGRRAGGTAPFVRLAPIK